MMPRTAAALCTILLLAGCYPEPADLKKELAELSAGQRGKVPPLPVLQPQPEPGYSAGTLTDPFYPDARRK